MGIARLGACLLALAAIARAQQPAATHQTPTDVLPLLNEQLILWATVLLGVGALPPLFEFLIERRKRRERLALSLEDEPVSALNPRLAGMDGLLESIADLIDRARHPQDYARLRIGNEALIMGPPLAGKKTLAQRIAKEAGLDRLITVHNPRSADALSKARSLVLRSASERVMLLLPRIDAAFEDGDEELLAELDALVESVSERPNVLVIGTALRCAPGDDVDNLFGIKIALPGAMIRPLGRSAPLDPELRRVLTEVTAYYLGRARAAGLALEGLSQEEFTARALERACNPAEIEDIVTLCETSAIYRKRSGAAKALLITPEILRVSIDRVIPAPAPSHAATDGAG